MALTSATEVIGCCASGPTKIAATTPWWEPECCSASRLGSTSAHFSCTPIRPPDPSAYAQDFGGGLPVSLRLPHPRKTPQVLSPLAHRSLFDHLVFDLSEHHSLYVNAGNVNAIRIELTRLNDLLDLGDGHMGRRRHDRIEIARSLAEDQVAPAISLPGFDQREIGLERAFHHVRTAVELAHFLAFCHDGACACGREKSGDTGAAGANPLGQ